MKLTRTFETKNNRQYSRYRILLTKAEGLRISKVGDYFEIFDADPKGELILHSPKRFDYNYSTTKPSVKTSFLLHVSKEDWARFKKYVRSKGLSVCEALSAYVTAVLADEDSVLERKITLNFYYQGRPRGHRRSLITATPSGASGPITSQN